MAERAHSSMDRTLASEAGDEGSTPPGHTFFSEVTFYYSKVTHNYSCQANVHLNRWYLFQFS